MHFFLWTISLPTGYRPRPSSDPRNCRTPREDVGHSARMADLSPVPLSNFPTLYRFSGAALLDWILRASDGEHGRAVFLLSQLVLTFPRSLLGQARPLFSGGYTSWEKKGSVRVVLVLFLFFFCRSFSFVGFGDCDPSQFPLFPNLACSRFKYGGVSPGVRSAQLCDCFH